MDAEEQELYDTLMLVAENNGYAYRKPYDEYGQSREMAALYAAFLEHRDRQRDQLYANWRAIKTQAEHDLGKKWGDY